MAASTEDELLRLTEELLDSIARRDWETYQRLCHPQLTAFEPEARSQRVEGLDFHRFYFDNLPRPLATRTTMVSPRVRWLGEDAAVLTYVRLVQSMDADGASHTRRWEETRVWQRLEGRWQHVHFHRSDNG